MKEGKLWVEPRSMKWQVQQPLISKLCIGQSRMKQKRMQRRLKTNNWYIFMETLIHTKTLYYFAEWCKNLWL